MTEKEILKRIKELLEVFHLSTNAFSQQIGLPQNSVNNYMKEKRGISIGFISSILNTYPNISAEWLLRGNGDMFESTYKILEGISGRIRHALYSLVEKQEGMTPEESISKILNYNEDDLEDILKTECYDYFFIQSMIENLSVNPIWILTGQGKMKANYNLTESRAIDHLLDVYTKEHKKCEELEQENRELLNTLAKYEQNKKEIV